jgi:hypothetical protein
MTAVAAPETPAAGTPEGTPAAAVPPVAAVSAAAGDVPATPAVVPPAAPVVPETYTLALPDQTLLDPKVTERVAAFAKANGLSQDAAQAVLAAHHAETQATIDLLKVAEAPGGELYKARTAELAAAALAHPEIGAGDPRKLTEATLRAQLVLNKFAPELLPVLEKSGEGSRPEVLLLLNRVAAAIGERPLVQSDGAPPKAPALTDAQAMYPEMYKKPD